VRASWRAGGFCSASPGLRRWSLCLWLLDEGAPQPPQGLAPVLPRSSPFPHRFPIGRSPPHCSLLHRSFLHGSSCTATLVPIVARVMGSRLMPVLLVLFLQLNNSFLAFVQLQLLLLWLICWSWVKSWPLVFRTLFVFLTSFCIVRNTGATHHHICSGTSP
jgi:hypothetical protein